jgi:RCC1 and BTB domain-containing protein
MPVVNDAATMQPTVSAKRLSEVDGAPRPLIFRKLPDSVLLSILGKLRRRVADRAACVCWEWRGAVSGAKLLGMYNVTLSLAAGGSTTAVCTEAGELFTFGKGDYGQLGHGGTQNEFVPRLVPALAGKTVIGAVTGTDHTAAWTDEGELFTVGKGHWGQLGHGGYQTERVPILVQGLAGKKVIGAAAGEFHTAAWTDEGELFTFGYGVHGQLGHGGEQTELVPRLVEALVGKKVIGASAGQYHTAVCTEAGELFTFGYGVYGQVGHGGRQQELVPRLVSALAGKTVIGASTCCNHTVVWTDEGELFTFGHRDCGQLGHGGTQPEFVPRLVEGLAGKKVIGAAAGLCHTAAWTHDGDAFTFGSGDHGQLGHGGEEIEPVPRLVEGLVGKKVVCAAAGESHTAAWTEEGGLFTFGMGGNGQLGHGDDSAQYLPRRVDHDAL